MVLVEGSFALFKIDWGDGGDNDTVSDNKDNTVRKKVWLWPKWIHKNLTRHEIFWIFSYFCFWLFCFGSPHLLTQFFGIFSNFICFMWQILFNLFKEIPWKAEKIRRKNPGKLLEINYVFAVAIMLMPVFIPQGVFNFQLAIICFIILLSSLLGPSSLRAKTPVYDKWNFFNHRCWLE